MIGAHRRDRRPLRFTWPVILAALVAALPHRAAEASQPPRYLAIFVGSGAYHGPEAVGRLEFADDDVLRALRTLAPSLAPDDVKVLVTPDPAVAAGLHGLGINRWQAPTIANLEQAFDWLEASLMHQWTSKAGGAPARVLLFACYSDIWFKTKGGQRDDAGQQEPAGQDPTTDPLDQSRPTDPADQFPDDALAIELRKLDRVGMISAQSTTIEIRMGTAGPRSRATVTTATRPCIPERSRDATASIRTATARSTTWRPPMRRRRNCTSQNH